MAHSARCHPPASSLAAAPRPYPISSENHHLNDSQPILRTYAHSLQGFFLRLLVALCNHIGRLENSAMHLVYVPKLWELRRDDAEDDVLVLGKIS